MIYRSLLSLGIADNKTATLGLQRSSRSRATTEIQSRPVRHSPFSHRNVPETISVPPHNSSSTVLSRSALSNQTHHIPTARVPVTRPFVAPSRSQNPPPPQPTNENPPPDIPQIAYAMRQNSNSSNLQSNPITPLPAILPQRPKPVIPIKHTKFNKLDYSHAS